MRSAAETFIVHGRSVQYRLGLLSAPKRYDWIKCGFDVPPSVKPSVSSLRSRLPACGHGCRGAPRNRRAARRASRRCGWRHDRAAAVRNERRLRLCRLGGRRQPLYLAAIAHPIAHRLDFGFGRFGAPAPKFRY